MPNFSFPLRDGKYRSKKNRNRNGGNGDCSLERDGYCDFEEFLINNKLYPNYSPNPEDYEQNECEFENTPLDESEYEEEKEFISQNEKVYFVFKPNFKDYMTEQLRSTLPSIPLFLLLSFAFGFASVKLILEKSWTAIIIIIPFAIITFLALCQINWLITSPFIYKKTKFLVTSKGVLWVRGFFRKKCNRLAYSQIGTISSSSRSKNTERIHFYTELRPSYKYAIIIFAVPKEFELGNKIIAVTKAVLLKQKPHFVSPLTTTQENNNGKTVDL